MYLPYWTTVFGACAPSVWDLTVSEGVWASNGFAWLAGTVEIHNPSVRDFLKMIHWGVWIINGMVFN